jgi:hypothetical protein
MNERACRHCTYACPLRPAGAGAPIMDWRRHLVCLNHAQAPGVLREVAPAGTCRNFRPRREPPLRLTPPAPPNDEIAFIPLTKGLFAIVDAADYEWLSRYRWHATGAPGRYYAATVIDGKSVSMHRLLMNPPPGMVTDHIDGNRLDNRRCNLRNCTPRQNRYNTPPCGKASPYVGVYPHHGKWQARLTVQGKSHFLGTFPTAREAAKARDAAARRHHGPHAWLNFPHDAEEPDHEE